MNGRWYLLCGVFISLFLAAAGCTNYSVGTVSYTNGTLDVAVAGPAAPSAVGVQITVYGLDQYSQHELFTTGTTATLAGGVDTVAVPLQLSPGNYKIYVYILSDGGRQAAVIRDITV